MEKTSRETKVEVVTQEDLLRESIRNYKKLLDERDAFQVEYTKAYTKIQNMNGSLNKAGKELKAIVASLGGEAAILLDGEVAVVYPMHNNSSLHLPIVKFIPVEKNQ